jgi:hypothetical protein
MFPNTIGCTVKAAIAQKMRVQGSRERRRETKVGRSEERREGGGWYKM